MIAYIFKLDIRGTAYVKSYKSVTVKCGSFENKCRTLMWHPLYLLTENFKNLEITLTIQHHAQMVYTRAIAVDDAAEEAEAAAAAEAAKSGKKGKKK